MEKQFIINYDDKIRYDEIDRAYFEERSLLSIIDRLFTTHSSDEDCSIFENEVFKKYYKDLELAVLKTSIVNELYGQNVLRPIVEEITQKKGIPFNWKLDSSIDEITISYTE